VVVPDDRTQDEPEGFVTLATIRARAKSAPSAEDFARTCPGPVLLVTEELAGASELPGPAPKSPSGSGFLIVTLEGQKGGAAARRYHGRLVFVAKRPGNPFPNMISIGRATSNDIVFALETISKLHGYFLREGDVWFYTDYQSTNGTIVNDRKVQKGEKRLVTDGDRFELGLDVKAQFLHPGSLYERIRGG